MNKELPLSHEKNKELPLSHEKRVTPLSNE
jgi:hypothetical protein